MSCNKYRPHLVILPEDDANHDIANGFINNLNVNYSAVDLRSPADGWEKVLEKFNTDYVSSMRKYQERRLVLLIDFDNRKDRLNYVQSQIPEELRDRVFVLGVLSNPETLKSDINMSEEKIGEALAKDCSENANEFWGHDLLKHNQRELARMILSVKPFLFN